MSALTETTVNVTAQATYPTLPQVTCLFIPNSWAFVDKSTTAIVHISFDGTNDHIQIDPTLYAGISWQSQGTKVWIRRDTAGVDTVNVVVMANSEE